MSAAAGPWRIAIAPRRVRELPHAGRVKLVAARERRRRVVEVLEANCAFFCSRGRRLWTSSRWAAHGATIWYMWLDANATTSYPPDVFPQFRKMRKFGLFFCRRLRSVPYLNSFFMLLIISSVYFHPARTQQRAACGWAAWAPGSQRAAGRSRRSGLRLRCVPGRGNRHGLNARAYTTGRNLVGGLLPVPSDLIPVLKHVIHDARVPSVAPQRVDLVADAKRCDGRRGCDSCLLATAGARYHRAPPRSCPSIRLGKLPKAAGMTPMTAGKHGRRGVQVLEANRAFVHC